MRRTFVAQLSLVSTNAHTIRTRPRYNAPIIGGAQRQRVLMPAVVHCLRRLGGELAADRGTGSKDADPLIHDGHASKERRV